MTALPCAPWWPPKPGDRLRHFMLTEDRRTGKIYQIHALTLVMAVFEHEGESLATVAIWYPAKERWHYETIRGWLEAESAYWPEGQPPPRVHPCPCCQPGARNPNWSDIGL